MTRKSEFVFILNILFILLITLYMFYTPTTIFAGIPFFGLPRRIANDLLWPVTLPGKR